MDRLNQLRGEAGASLDSTLDTSSLQGDAYMTANESSKYFSLSEVNSSSTVSTSKEAADNVTTDNPILNAERIISDLSPIPKKSEMNNFKIGEQIEAANILSGGVNIFDDNENSYDGDELVIDDAVVEADEKPAESKMNEGETFEKIDRLANTSTEDVEAAIPSKDTEVVLQIDGKNVDAIDIGNGLYLYRKDGEEELAAVQILDDNQQQPDIKFLKVRENAEGNLEVYEEIEIEIPKEVPSKEGIAIKNTSHVPVKGVNKESEPVKNKVSDNRGQEVKKDNTVKEEEIDINKDSNTHLDTRTEVNLNGKMIKFSESRKSPLIGSFTPMTYHSTPNKEGIPLTKTMVDLQLHPNRHSENIKKTIEVHTDNCKQRLLETPTKSFKDSNDCNKSPEFMSSLDKVSTVIDKVDHASKEVNKAIIENQLSDIVAIKVNDDNSFKDTVVKSQQMKSFHDNELESNDKETTESNDNNAASIIALKKPVFLSVQCELKSTSNDKEDNAEAPIKKLLHLTCSKVNNEFGEMEAINDLTANTGEVKQGEHEKTKNSKANFYGMEADENIVKEKQSINSDNIITENLNNIDTVMLTKTESNIIGSASPCETPQSISNISTENIKYSKLPQSGLETKDFLNVKKLVKDSIEPLETTPNNLNPDHQTLEISDSSTKSTRLISNMEIITVKNQATEMLNSSSSDKKLKSSIQSELPISPKGTDSVSTEILQEDATTAHKTYQCSVTKKDTSMLQNQPSVNKLDNSPNKEESKNVVALKQQDKELKINLSDVNMKSNKRNEEQSDIIPQLNETSNNAPEHKQIYNINLKKPVKLSNVDANINQPVTGSHKIYSDASKLALNKDFKGLYKNLPTTEQNCSRGPLYVIKPSSAETQSKNESSQKLPVHNTNAKVLCSDLKMYHPAKNIPNEVDCTKMDTKKEQANVNKVSLPKPTNNNKAAVPFGKWTEANRQEFLNKIKESKVPISTSNTKQLKQPNDLNRRDVLQKIDSQRQSNIASTKVQELNILNKVKPKQDTVAFASKSSVPQKEKSNNNKVPPSVVKPKETVPRTPTENKVTFLKKANKEQPITFVPVDMSSTALISKKDPVHRKEINNQDLIDKTIEGIINRAVTTKLGADDPNQDVELVEKPPTTVVPYTAVSLDEIESKMNELHGIPFVERPPHELPQVHDHENKSNVVAEVSTTSKVGNMPNVLSCSNKPQLKNEHKTNQSIIAKVSEESDEEIIEHQPVTGDIVINKSNTSSHIPAKDTEHPEESKVSKSTCGSKKEPIITENDFDKFARRNSITYENCLTVSFDGKEHHNVVKTVVEKETVAKKLSRNETMLAESKAKSHKQIAMRHGNFSSKIPTTVKTTVDEDSYNKNYQSKVQIAYQSVMTAKRQQECPITIIEDKPVKVVFMDSHHEYTPHQLNVQGKELSPPKKSISDWDHFTHSNSESLDSDILDATNDSKSQDDVKFKSKHQRKQVLTPVEAPELELIEPGDLGIEVSPKKKRKVEDNKAERNSKSLVPKKSYLLNRNIITADIPSNSHDLTKTPLKESVNQRDVFVKHQDPISAIDNLVKAAELLETQSENKHTISLTDQNSISQQNSPVKRGRGRPRKYPLPETTQDKSHILVKTPTPQKKPRLIDAKIPKHETESDDDEMNSDGEFVKENWTMGKINENIVCPICSKLFRSENVVFKHVKHCTGPSPSRSDSDKRSPRRLRQSQELDWKSEGSKSDSMDVDEDYEINKSKKKKKSKEKRLLIDNKPDDKIDIIVIEDTPIKDRDSPIKKRDRLKHELNQSMMKSKIQHGTGSLVCEFCGKTFRQLSYLVNHKIQHKNSGSKKFEKDPIHKSLFNCEICKKEFRKLHHLVQHRIIHNPNSKKPTRKSSIEQNDVKMSKDVSRAIEDLSAGFRCEPCDKSFRKLHHLVEHRETHDEINKKSNPVASNIVDTSKPTPLHHCDICKKTFNKLQLLIEHKDHHLDTSSEKSDDKSVQSSLSTKDIIHECPLCYMVFPNEHSLNKHHIICQRKKKQSAAKQAKKIEENDNTEADDSTKVLELGDENIVIEEQDAGTDTVCVVIEDETVTVFDNQEGNKLEVGKRLEGKKEIELNNDINPANVEFPFHPETDIKSKINDKIRSTNKKDGHERNADNLPVKTKKHVFSTTAPVEIIKIADTTPMPKKKIITKHKIGTASTKKQKTTNTALLNMHHLRTPDSSDDDEIRYMLNPDLQMDESNERKPFMKVRAKKRNSLQIERPNSKELIKRRISLQHPAKIPRLKVKPIPRKQINSNNAVKSSKTTTVPLEPLALTDSDDSDVKYSFPEPVIKEMEKEAQNKVRMQKIIEKRKSLSSMAKRKSLGKINSVKQKMNVSPVKQTKKRITDAEHRCDCGQLFSSAALLTRHTSLAHTPPRIRRRRSPPPDNDAKPTSKRIGKSQETRKTIDTAPKKTGVTTRKSSVNKEAKTVADGRKTPKSTSLVKTRRSAPHKGVPLPDKMRKLMDKSKK